MTISAPRCFPTPLLCVLVIVTTTGCFHTVRRPPEMLPNLLSARDGSRIARSEVTAVLTNGNTLRFRPSRAIADADTLVVHDEEPFPTLVIRRSEIDHFELRRQDDGETALAVVGVILGLLAAGFATAVVVGIENLPTAR